MSLIKKIDVKKHFAARRAMRRAAARPASQPGATAIPETKAADAKTSVQGFVEDFGSSTLLRTILAPQSSSNSEHGRC